MRVIDLSMPITTDHPRWKTEISVTGDLAAGDLAQVTSLKVSCHAYTHVDARRHMFADGPTIEATPLSDVVGECAVLDLMDVAENEAIGPERLASAGSHVSAGDIVLFKTGWDQHRAPDTREFWTDAPYLTRGAAVWLKKSGAKTVVYDFPQDYPIRLLLDGEVRPLSEHVTHDVLLRTGVNMVEYVCNTASLRQPRVLFSAAPLKIPGADGAPARAYAIEGALQL
jgi:kynurenine formamidase